MASVCCNNNTVSVSCGTKTVLVGLSEATLCTFTHSDMIASDDSQPGGSRGSSESDEVGFGMICSNISSNGKLLAFCTMGKLLCIVDLNEIKPSVVRVYNLIRGASKVIFTPITNNVVVADKSGDVYLFKPQSDDKSGQLILGHLSLLTGVLITPDEQFIITCDRDEKIRISRYPEGYIIVSYCLGHKEFVSSLHLLPHNKKCLISTSGDGTIRFWDYKVGTELLVCDVSKKFNCEHTLKREDKSEEKIASITDSSTICVNSSTSLICVTVDNFSACFVFRCSSENEKLDCSFMQSIPLENRHPWGLSLSCNILWLLLGCTDNVLVVQTKVLNVEACKFVDSVPENITKAVQEINNQKLIADQKQHVFELLLKGKFDNIQEYLKKKEMRLSEPPIKKVKS